MKILLSGGGTGGSVTPLLAIAEKLASMDKKVVFLWLGTKKGGERKMVEAQNIKFKSIFSGKYRRYFSYKNFIDPVFICFGFFQSLWINLKFKPDMILTAGSFVAVPVVWAGWILRIPVLIHQQDVKVGLANKLMAPFASIITLSLEKSIKDFKKSKNVYFTGNAVRKRIYKNIDKNEALERFGLEKDLPTLFIFGGGTGAMALNKLIVQSVPELVKFCQIIHGAGNYKRIDIIDDELTEKRYRQYNFIENIEDAYNASDLVISRAGAVALSELAVSGKPVISIPIPDSHQEYNAKYFKERKAAILLNQKEITPEKLVNIVKDLLRDKGKMNELSLNIQNIMPMDGTTEIADIVLKRLKNKE